MGYRAESLRDTRLLSVKMIIRKGRYSSSPKGFPGLASGSVDGESAFGRVQEPKEQQIVSRGQTARLQMIGPTLSFSVP